MSEYRWIVTGGIAAALGFFIILKLDFGMICASIISAGCFFWVYVEHDLDIMDKEIEKGMEDVAIALDKEIDDSMKDQRN